MKFARRARLFHFHPLLPFLRSLRVLLFKFFFHLPFSILFIRVIRAISGSLSGKRVQAPSGFWLAGPARPPF